MAGKVALDEKGFIFMQDGEPHLCRIYGMKPWLFRWLNDHWVPLIEVTQTNVDKFPQNLSLEAQQTYRQLQEEYKEKHAKASAQRGLPESSGRRYR